MSFLQVKSSMTLKEKLRQVRNTICVNRRKIAHMKLEAVADADNPYSLIPILGRGYLAIKTGRAVYVTRCAPVAVVRKTNFHVSVRNGSRIALKRKFFFAKPAHPNPRQHVISQLREKCTQTGRYLSACLYL
jgi:hypothetical protein